MFDGDWWDWFFVGVAGSMLYDKGKERGASQTRLEIENKDQRDAINELQRKFDELLRAQK